MQNFELSKELNKELKYEITNSYGKTKKLYLFLKRSFDIVSSLCAIIVFSPVLLILSIIVKLDSKGPILFAHKRLGKNGKIIKVYKYRTMLQDAESLIKKLSPEQKKEYEKNFKLEKDPRVTKLGEILRKTSLDELPQLFNIFIGNMSVVGPRPIVEKELDKYGVFSDKLLSVKPGLTGNWQANGRSDTTYEKRVKLDMEYIDNQSFFRDIGIILKTVIVVFRREGAR